MITPAQKRQLKIYLKGNYTDEVLDILLERNILSKRNKPYSKSMVRNVLNGNVEHYDIENAIIEVYRRRVKQYKIQEALKTKLLQD